MDRELGIVADVSVDKRHGEALASVVAITTGCREPHPFIIEPDWFIAGGVGVVGVDFQGHQTLQCTVFLAGLQCCVTADEIQFCPVYPTIHPSHGRGAVLCEFSTPDTKAFFQPQRIHGVETKFADSLVTTCFKQHLPQRGMFKRTAVDLVAELSAH